MHARTHLLGRAWGLPSASAPRHRPAGGCSVARLLAFNARLVVALCFVATTTWLHWGGWHSLESLALTSFCLENDWQSLWVMQNTANNGRLDTIRYVLLNIIKDLLIYESRSVFTPLFVVCGVTGNSSSWSSCRNSTALKTYYYATCRAVVQWITKKVTG